MTRFVLEKIYSQDKRTLESDIWPIITAGSDRITVKGLHDHGHEYELILEEFKGAKAKVPQKGTLYVRNFCFKRFKNEEFHYNPIMIMNRRRLKDMGIVKAIADARANYNGISREYPLGLLFCEEALRRCTRRISKGQTSMHSVARSHPFKGILVDSNRGHRITENEEVVVVYRCRWVAFEITNVRGHCVFTKY